jgi:hypothetical protein
MTSHALPVTAPPRSHSRAALRVVQPPSGVDLVAAEQAAAAFLVALGVDLDTESLSATPARMARAYAEMFSPRPCQRGASLHPVRDSAKGAWHSLADDQARLALFTWTWHDRQMRSPGK